MSCYFCERIGRVQTVELRSMGGGKAVMVWKGEICDDDAYRLRNLSEKNRYRRTGVFLTCPRCGHRWERRSTSGGYQMCKKCRAHVEAEPLRFVQEGSR